MPGVVLLSRWRWSGLPVEVAILFGPGLSAIILFFNVLMKKNKFKNESKHSRKYICIIKGLNFNESIKIELIKDTYKIY